MNNTGLIQQPLKGKSYIAGWVTGIPDTIINERGDWRGWLPEYEPQFLAGKFDTMGCVSFSALNTIEILHKFHYNDEINLSDRFTAKMSGTTRRGNWFTRVWDSIRKDGVLDEDVYPFGGNTWDEYMQEVPVSLQAKGKNHVKLYDIGYEFLYDRKTNNRYMTDDVLREGLKRGPLQVSIGNDQTGVQAHALTLTNLGIDGTRYFFDHYAGGQTTNPSNRKIYSALRPHLRLTNERPNMPILPNNCFVFMAEPPGLFGLHVDGKMYVDELEKIQAQWIMRNEENGFFKKAPVRTISREQWEQFPKFNLKNEKIN